MNLSSIVNSDGGSLLDSFENANESQISFNGSGSKTADKIVIDEELKDVLDNGMPETPFEDAPIQQGGLERWRKTGRTLKFRHNPVGFGGLAWIANASDRNQDAEERELQLFPSPVTERLEKPWYRNMVKECYAIIKEYSAQARQHEQSFEQRDAFHDRYDAEFVGRIFAAINRAEEQGAQEDDAQNDETLRALADASNVVGCFGVTVYLPRRADIGGPFANWVSRVDPGWTKETVEEIMETNPPTTHPEFWRYIDETCCRGLLDVCAESLRQASKHQDDLSATAREIYEHAMDLLQSFPDNGDPLQFKQWRAAVINAGLRAQDLEDAELKQQFQKVFKLLQGDIDTILQVADNWLQAVGALVKFHDPSRSRLREYYERAVKVHPLDTTIDWIVGAGAVVRGEVLKAIQMLEGLDACVAATMAEFCFETGLLETYMDVAGDARQPVVDWLVMSHAQQCLCDAELASTGLGLLEMVGSPSARAVIAEVLPRIRWETTAQIEEALDLARRLDLPDTERRLNMSVATTCFATGRFLTGFNALEKAENAPALAKWVWKLFEDTLVQLSVQGDAVTKSIVSGDLSQVLGDAAVSPQLREFLAPVAVLSHFIQHLEAGQGVVAAKFASVLFQFPYLPSKYIGLLIAAVSPLVSRKHPRVFTTAALVSIVDCLDRWESGDESDVHEGMLLIEASLAAAQASKGSLGPHDWRRAYSAPVAGDKVIKYVRSDLAHEFARAYLDGA